MGHKRSVGHRLFDAPQAALYGVGTVASAAVTTAAGVGVLGCALAIPAAGVSIIPGILFAGIGYAGAIGTTYFGSKTIHKTSHVLGGKKDCHSLKHAKFVAKLGQ